MTEEALTQVRAAHRFDEAALERYLSEQLKNYSGPLSVRQFEGGQSNPTFLLETSDKKYVLRKKPPGPLLPSAHMVEREYWVLNALQNSAVPVPKVHVLCEDERIIGTPFFVMDYVESRLLRDPTLPDMGTDTRKAIYQALAETLAALHNLDYQAAGLTDFGKTGGYIARQTRRWSEQYRASKTREIEAMEKLMDWLPQHIPAEDSTCLVHGDFRLDNMLFHPGEPRVLAVLDWELSTLGHPLSDLAYTCMVYHIQMPAGYLGEVAGQDGIPAEQDFVAEYCRLTGRESIPNWDFYLAFSLFRYAAIVQGVHFRGLQGNASSESALHYGELVETAGQHAWGLVRS